MVHIIGATVDKQIYCPLCDQPFKTRRIKLRNGKVTTAYFCVPDNIMIFAFDPMLNKWRDTNKPVPCPNCNTPMKWFGRMLDCYMKAECPACGICVEKDSDMAMDPKRGVEIEDMQQPEPEVLDIQIPIDKLNLTAEKKAALRKKIRARRSQDGK